MRLWGKSPYDLELERQMMLARREYERTNPTPADLGAKYAPPIAPMVVVPRSEPKPMHPLAIVIIAGLSCLGVIWIIEQIL